MKILFGHPNNVVHAIMGKVTWTGRNVFNRRTSVLIAAKGIRFTGGYAALLTDQENAPTKIATVSSISGLSELHEGDVVLISQDGSIHVLYDCCSSHHAILVTERCNQNCIMCPQPRVQQEKTKTDLNLKLISLFARKADDITLTGGEPTLIGDDLFTLLNAIRRRIPMASVNLLTNGVRLADFNYARQLAAVRHPNLRIEIPLYADTDSEHNRIVGAETFYQTLQGFYNLARLHLNVGVRIVIHRQTYNRLPQLAEFIYRNLPFACHVMFMHLEPTGSAAQNITKLWIDPYECNPALQEAVLQLFRRKVNVSIYNAPLCVLPEELRQFARQSISEWKNIFLPICTKCGRKSACAGFFASALHRHSAHLAPFPVEN